MIVTVTPNTTIDQTLFVPTFPKNKTIRATHTIQSMGGKPTDAAWIMGKIGIPSLALGFKAGSLGVLKETMLHAHGVETDFIPVGGSTRLNTVIISADDGAHSTITTSTLEVTDEQIDALKQQFESKLDEATCVITGGTLPKAVPPSFYTDIIGMARKRDIPVIFDADEPNLSAGLQSRPSYIKPNRDELSALVGRTIKTLDEAYQAGREIIDRYGTQPIITLGGEGALAVLTDTAYRIPPIDVEVVSPAGAGDGVLAGLATSIYRGQPIEAGLKQGVAFATAVLLQAGTAAYEVADMERFLPQVELIAYP